jgi:hypothetical protein
MKNNDIHTHKNVDNSTLKVYYLASFEVDVSRHDPLDVIEERNP